VNALFALPLVVLLLILIPAGLLSMLGLAVLVLKIIAIVQKAGEARTEDEHGQYSLDQSKDVGR